ncbi:MAG: phosphoribosylamine--glycine ligase [Halofilum sp. (in: g-proteobacteria)]|nr:phosphoribosylamine--glycine ligase [Halofilum sp. (in: g-proteobacteria)]
MRILVVGGGGREHALAWKLAQSPRAERVFAAPGNAGTAAEPGIENVEIGAEDLDALLAFAGEHDVGLTVVGPEAPLVAGIVDRFRAAGHAIVGPSRAAAELEGSKAFAKDFLARHDIPTAAYRTFDAVEPALEWIRERGAPLVVKADGLAAGKGVVVARDGASAEAAVRDMLGGSLGGAGARVVIEDFLEGEEASFICLVAGRTIVPLASSQDHKARDDGDRGPNTGGMGAYSPAPVVTDAVHERIMRDIIEPTVSGLAAEDRPFSGFLYAGLMISPEGTPRTLEFNVRGGDPETQPIVLRLASDLVDLCEAVAHGTLGEIEPRWDPRAALGVVMAAGGYPGSYRKGDLIHGLDAELGDEVKVFHAGTVASEDGPRTSGGRVLCVTALGRDVAAARDAAYAAVQRIDWQGAFYRSDIGHRAVDR